MGVPSKVRNTVANKKETQFLNGFGCGTVVEYLSVIVASAFSDCTKSRRGHELVHTVSLANSLPMAHRAPSNNSSEKTYKSGSRALLVSHNNLATFSDEVFAELSEDLRPGSSAQQHSQPQLPVESNLTANKAVSSARLGPAAALGAAMGTPQMGDSTEVPDGVTNDSCEPNNESMMIVAKQISRLYRHMLEQLPRDVQIRTQQHLILRTAEVRSAGVPVQQAAMVVQQELLPLMHRAFVHFQSQGLTGQKQNPANPEPLAPVKTRVDVCRDQKHLHKNKESPIIVAPTSNLKVCDDLNAGNKAVPCLSSDGCLPSKRIRLGCPQNDIPIVLTADDGTNNFLRGSVLPMEEQDIKGAPQTQSPTANAEVIWEMSNRNKEQHVKNVVTTRPKGQGRTRNQNISGIATQLMLNPFLAAGKLPTGELPAGDDLK